jgi:tetratricopeptide (TPR) repeat protein
MFRKAFVVLVATCLATTLGAQDDHRSQVTKLVDDGRAAYRNNDTEQAVALFQKALALENKNVDAHVWLGRMYATQVQTASFFRKPTLASRAIGELDRAVALDPRNVEARVARTEYYMYAPGIAGGGIDKAQAEAAIGKKLDPFRGGFLVARVAERAKDLTAAEGEYRALIAAFPDSSSPAAGLAGFFQNQQRWGDAFGLIDAELSKAPSNPDMLYQLGRAAALSGQRLEQGEAALRAYLGRPLPHEAGDASAHWRLARILELRRDTQGAREEYTITIKLDPRNEDAKRAIDRLGKR